MNLMCERSHTESNDAADVYFTSRITQTGLLDAYHALGREAHGKVAVEVSSGEPGGHNFLSRELIKPLVDEVHGVICECNTAYGGRRCETAEH